MARKKFNLKFIYDAPVTITFALVCIVIYLLDTFVLKDYLKNNILTSPTSLNGTLHFVFSDFISYPRLVLYIFSSNSIGLLLTNLVFILLLGPSMEERYGSIVIGIMIFVSALFSGVLTACFGKESLQGAGPIVFMMIFLSAFMAFSKKKLPMSFLMIFGMYVAIDIMELNLNGVVGVIINIAGGLCGSLFAFLTSPRARAENRYNKKIEEIDNASPRFHNTKKTVTKQKNDTSNDETIVGTLKF